MSKKSDSQIKRDQELIDDAWLGIDRTSDEVFNPLENVPENEFENPSAYILWLLSNPEYFSLFCKNVLNITLHPIQIIVLRELWNKKFPMLLGSRAFGKSFLLALYCILRMVFIPGRKIVMTGAGFRQSKLIFAYMEKIWDSSPILRDLAGPNSGYSHGTDAYEFKIGESTAYALPVGDGTRIRGYRAHDILIDEFAVGNPEILEHVIFGFAAVNAAPIENVKRLASLEKARSLGYEIEDEGDTYTANQIVLSGTAYYEFNHSYRYFCKYRNIINSRGDKKKLMECGADPDRTDWLDYSIIRIPYYLMPKGFMAEDIIIRSKNNMHISLFLMEFCAVFTNDTTGFFKRTLLEKCVSNFNVSLYGDRTKEYILGVDPASELDNFSLVFIEIDGNIRKIINCWTTTKQSYKEELKSGRAKENDFYDYVCRKILDLYYESGFKFIGIAMDSQGGGHEIAARLHNEKILKDGELPLWLVEDPDKPTEDDLKQGNHIIELINFADAKWTGDANHGLRSDFETRSILFPKFDGLIFAEADLSSDNDGDKIEEVILEIEEMKNELSSIVMTQTSTGRDRWDTPDQKIAGAKKGRMRKDRYSALLMANYLAKKLKNKKPDIAEYSCEGGIAKKFKAEELTNQDSFLCTKVESSKKAKQLNDLYRYL